MNYLNKSLKLQSTKTFINTGTRETSTGSSYNFNPAEILEKLRIVKKEKDQRRRQRMDYALPALKKFVKVFRRQPNQDMENLLQACEQVGVEIVCESLDALSMKKYSLRHWEYLKGIIKNKYKLQQELATASDQTGGETSRKENSAESLELNRTEFVQSWVVLGAEC